uniref:Uncharacterized protein n=1 Tax=Echinococcus granulosus TaxID=6210 RepID=A0A068W9D4_ECHGR|nr:hypothetical protein EgrG_000907100 [Echinococcus granulosus]
MFSTACVQNYFFTTTFRARQCSNLVAYFPVVAHPPTMTFQKTWHIKSIKPIRGVKMVDPPITEAQWEEERTTYRGPVLNFLQGAMDRVKRKKLKCEDCENEVKGCALLTVCLLN